MFSRIQRSSLPLSTTSKHRVSEKRLSFLID
jgi:hypothetical protein